MNQPDNLFCPRCSATEFRTQDCHKYICGRCRFQYFHNVASTTALVMRAADSVLFSVRGREPAKGLLDFPGGFVDPGETLERALARELLEELNWIPTAPLRYLFSFPNTYLYDGVNYSTVDAFFGCDLDARPDLTAQDDVEDLVWRRLSDIDMAELAFSSMVKAVKKLIELGY